MRCAKPLLLIVCLLGSVTRAETKLNRLTDESGDTLAVTVPQDAWLTHTSQQFGGSPAELLGLMDLAPEQAVRLNVVATTVDNADAARHAIRDHFPTNTRPAISVVLGSLPEAGAVVGIDAVIVDASRKRTTPIIFISGQAEKGSSLVDATARTSESLKKTLAYVGCSPREVVSARFFITPMSGLNESTETFRREFDGLLIPSSAVEWKSSVPVEIELVAVASQPAPADAPAVEYLTPTGMQASPLFARVVRVNRGELVYYSDIAANSSGDATSQVLSVFEQLTDRAARTGCDLRHLVKATYFVSDDATSKKLNELRPRLYDPARPPAASKALVPVVAVKDRSITIDMIGVKEVTP